MTYMFKVSSRISSRVDVKAWTINPDRRTYGTDVDNIICPRYVQCGGIKRKEKRGSVIWNVFSIMVTIIWYKVHVHAVSRQEDYSWQFLWHYLIGWTSKSQHFIG